MNILFYYPDNQVSISLVSLMNAFRKQGHEVSLLTHSPIGAIHELAGKSGVKSYHYKPAARKGMIRYFSHVRHLALFCREHKIGITFSHTQSANIIACIAQFFYRGSTVICRHHSDSVYTGKNRKEKLADFIINRLGKSFIAPSRAVYDQMVYREKVDSKKIHLINYGYDFGLFEKPNEKTAQRIKNETPASLVLITIGRLIPLKRHIHLLEAVRDLVKERFDLHLHVLGDGPLRKELGAFIIRNELQNIVTLHGHKTNIFDYMKASDLLVHISESEASNGVVKEASLAGLPVLVCKNVGDFDDYVNEENALLISRDFTQEELVMKLKSAYSNKANLHEISTRLRKNVEDMFEINNVIGQYDSFLKTAPIHQRKEPDNL